MTHRLSSRGNSAAGKPLRMDMKIYQEAMESRYHAEKNQEGTFPMAIAENQLCWDMQPAQNK